MAQMAALMVLLNHTKEDCKCSDENTTLSKMSNFFQYAEDENMKNKQDAYLYFETNNGNLIRSGKVTGCGFLSAVLSTKRRQRQKELISVFISAAQQRTALKRNCQQGRDTSIICANSWRLDLILETKS